MKNIFKKAFYSLFRLFSHLNTHAFSNFLISWGYLIRSESLYNKSKIRAFDDRLDMHQHLVNGYLPADEKILFLEFGVYKGQTYKLWVAGNTNPGSEFAGFDTFTGLPEDWGNIKSGSFSAGGKLPDVQDPRSKFYVGLIQDTLPEFVKNLSRGQRRIIIHIDVDLYNATLITLQLLHPYLQAGDILIFDDFFSLTKAAHEFKAFNDYLDLYHTPYKPLFKCRNGHLVAEIAG